MRAIQSLGHLAAIAVFVLLFVLASSAHAAPLPPSPWADERVERWAKDMMAGRTTRVFDSTEADLRSPKPHPLALAFHDDAARVLGKVPSETLPGAKALNDIHELRDRRNHELARRYGTATAWKDVDFYGLLLVGRAIEGDRERELAVLDEIARRHPTAFVVAWEYEVLANGGEPQWKTTVLEHARARTEGTPTWKALQALTSPRRTTIDDLAAVDAFLEAYPTDALAHRRRALLLETTMRLEAALAAHRRATELFPPDGSTAKEAQLLVSLGRDAEARTLLAARRARLEAPAAEPELASSLDVMKAYRSAGELGRARDAIAELIMRFPADATAYQVLARLELDVERNDQAVAHARKAVELDPRSALGRALLVEALRRSGRPDQAHQAFLATKKELPELTSGLYSQAHEALIASKRPADAIVLAEEALRELPSDVNRRRDLAEAQWLAGEQRQAIETMRRALGSTSGDSWGTGKLLEWVEELDGRDAAQGELDALLERDPTNHGLWSRAIERAASGKAKDPAAISAKIEVARAAREANPGAAWPWALELDVLRAARRWEDAWELASMARAQSKAWSRGQQLEALHDQMWLLLSEIRNRRVDAKRLEWMLEQAAAYRPANESDYQRYLSIFYDALGRQEQAFEAKMARAAVSPDSDDAVWSLIRHDGHTVEALGTVHRYVTRNPYSGPRLRLAADIHGKWGGSPVVALYYATLARERAPASFDGIQYGMALGALGDAARSWELIYQRSTSLSESDRYVGWWDHSRQAAQEDSTTIALSFDKATHARCSAIGRRPEGLPADAPHAVICGSDGDVSIRADDLVTGLPLLRRSGARFVRAEYNQEGDVRLIEASDGRKIELDYDRARRVTALRRSNGSKLTFGYDGDGRLVEVGSRERTLRLKYDSDGNLEPVETVRGSGTLRDVAAALSELEELVAPLGNGHLPELPVEDPKREELRRKLEEPRGSTPTGELVAKLALAEHLVDHLDADVGYASEAASLLESAFEAVEASPALASHGPRIVKAYGELMRESRPVGLTRDEYRRLGDMQAWLRGPGARQRGTRKLLAELSASPLPLREPDQWLPHSDLVNPGMWRRHLYGSLVPDRFVSQPFDAALVRRNHELVIGGAGGLSIHRRGFWEWYPFDSTRQRFDPNLEPSAVNPGWEVLALAETTDGALWVGTANGLLRLAGSDYTAKLERWSGAEQGLPSIRITHLQALGSKVLVATPAGARLFDASGHVPGMEALESVAVGGVSPSVVAANDGIYWIDEATASATRVSTFVAEDAIWSEESRGIVALSSGSLWLVTPTMDAAGHWVADGAPAPVPLPASSALTGSKRIHGLSELPIDQDSTAVAVHTDQGIDLYHDHHLEHMELPGSDGAPAVRVLAGADQRAIALTNEGAFVYDRGSVLHFLEGSRVFDVLSVPEAKLTYVATGDSLLAIFHANPEAGPQLVDLISATRIVSDRRGGIVTHDGHQILHYDARTGAAKMLFFATPSAPSDHPDAPGVAGPLRDILVAKDGTIWAAVGSSLFRYREGDDAPEELSVYVDPERFPIRSHFVSRIIETITGKIWIIGSNEGHLVHDGTAMSGGVVEYDGSSFRRVELEDETDGWFIHRYTPIDERTAIASTTDGMAIHTASGAFELLHERDSSYKRLRKRVPSLFMGTTGAKLGDDTWLFGTAGGLVGYWQGRWLMPERLNWLLPDQGLSAYGSRAVHGVATDALGRVYVGTDRGLTIYDSGSPESTALLMDNGLSNEAFADESRRRLDRQTDIIISGLEPSSELAKRVERISAMRRELARAEDRLAMEMAGTTLRLPKVSDDVEHEAAEDDAKAPASVTSLRAEVVRKRKTHRKALLELERENPVLHQMLSRKPIELEKLRSQMPRDTVLVQYLPTQDRLFIHLLSHGTATIEEVKVSRRELYDVAATLSTRLASDERAEGVLFEHRKHGTKEQRQGPDKGRAKSSSGGVSLRGLVRVRLASHAEGTVEDHLEWLYEQLLRPIERNLEGFEYVYVMPVGPLSYVPFEALIRNDEGRVEYAVERFAIGYVTEAHMLDTVLRSIPSTTMETVVFADPDGSLQDYGRPEGKRVAARGNHNALFVGRDASYESYLREAPNAGYLHLVTHGVLDPRRPERSYLLLAQDHRLAVPDIASIEIPETNMVVLSACNSGLGMQGLEYATLARAFMLAGARTVVATLWSLPEHESTTEIVDSFYANVDRGRNRLVALAEAKREYLRRPGAIRDPYFWASFVLFGSG